MRIGVLEWASCGGIDGSVEVVDSIRTEGWAMCRAALISLAQAGHQAVALVDGQSAIDPLISGYRSSGFGTGQLELVPLSACDDVWTQWQRVYASCDYTLVIAPESDRVLERLLSWCHARCVRTCNCGVSFVRRASDKLLTARLLLAQNLPHPSTRSLGNTSAKSTGVDDKSAWVIKPRYGVGCEGTQRVGAHELRSRGELAPLGWIVQPWLSGEAFSRSAIVDRSGRLHWLPVTRQHLAIGERIAYLGGSVEPELGARIPALDELLTQAIDALGGHPLGWIGIDFLYDAGNERQPVTIIEINPRLTTSFVGLARAGAPDLAAAIVAGVCGEPVELPRHWQKIRFTADGTSERSSRLSADGPSSLNPLPHKVGEHSAGQDQQAEPNDLSLGSAENEQPAG